MLYLQRMAGYLICHTVCGSHRGEKVDCVLLGYDTM
jgi:hypothetical protein